MAGGALGGVGGMAGGALGGVGDGVGSIGGSPSIMSPNPLEPGPNPSNTLVFLEINNTKTTTINNIHKSSFFIYNLYIYNFFMEKIKKIKDKIRFN
jgi:hypothetical protein